ncbi:MAG: translocation/assembly module TamB [Ignavibacteria bacterium]|nr:translocation/assembly module TamB [Ignavibacteria bacterium]
MDKESQNIKENPEGITKDSSNKTSNKKNNIDKNLIKKSIIKKLFKYFLWIDTVIFILLVTFVILLQTTFFKTWLLKIVINQINNNLVSKESYIYAESLEGNIITNLKLNNAYIVVKNDTLLRLKSINLNHKFFRIFDKVIDIDYLEVEAPQVNLTKVVTGLDTLWNFEYLLKPEIPEIDTTKKEFDWEVYVKNADIKNLDFRSLEYKPYLTSIRDFAVKDSKHFNINDLDISKANLNFSGKYTKSNKSVKVNKLTLDINSFLELKNLSFEAAIDKDTRIEDFKLQTSKTDIEINKISLENFSPFYGIDFNIIKEKNFSLNLNAKKVDFSDIEFFVPEFNQVKGTYAISISAEGKYDDFYLNNLNINDTKNKINLAGRVTNLSVIENLYLNMNLINSEIDPEEIKRNLVGINIPEFSGIGKTTATIKFEGQLKNFYTKFNINSSAGSAEGDARINLNNSEPIYKAAGSVKNLNIGKITGNHNNNYLITSEFNLDGRGLDYKTMTAKLNYNLSNSIIANQKIIKSAGEIRLIRGQLNLDVVYVSNIGSVNVKGEVDFRNFSDIKYDLKGASQSLNLSAISPNLKNSNLNFEYNIKGSGFDLNEITEKGKFNPDKLVGEFKVNLASSIFEDYFIPPSPIYAIISNDGNTKNFILSSNFIDLTCSGNFKIETIPSILISNVEKITKKLNERLTLDSSNYSNLSLNESKDLQSSYPLNISQELRTNIKLKENFNIKYNALIKNLLPIYILTKDSSLSFTGLIKGELKQTENIFAFSSEGRIENFRFRDSLLRILNTNFSFDLTDLNQRDDYRDIYSNLYLNASGIYNKSNKYESLYLQFNTIDTNNLITIKGKIDSNFYFYTRGNSRVSNKQYNFAIDTLDLIYFNYHFSNPQDLLLSFKPANDSLGTNDIVFKNFILTDQTQKLEIGGIYSIDGNSNLNITSSKININKLFNYIYGNNEELIKGNIRKLYLNYSGTFEKPSLIVEMTTDPLSIKEFKLGRIDAIINYNDNIAKSEIGFFNPNNEGKLYVRGNMPIMNPFIKKELSKDDINFEENKSFLENEINLTIKAENYQTKLFEKFIPAISDLDAKVNSDISVKGKLISPEISGEAKIDKGTFKLKSTDVKYNFDAVLNASGQKLLLNYFKLFTPDNDRRFISSNGYIDLTNLKFNEIDLIFTGDVKVLTPDVTRNEIGVYGDLIVGAGQIPIRLRGNSDSITLTGTIVLKKGNIFIPSLKSDAYSLYVDNINYKILIDSLSLISDSSLINIQLLDTSRKQNVIIFDPFEYQVTKTKDTIEIKKKSKGNFIFDLNIISENKIFLKFVVDEQTRQEFMGEIDIKLFADNRNKESPEVRGNVEIDENSIYKFYKNFKAKGNIKFTGDISNPDLNIVAEYAGSSYNQELQTSRNVIVQLNVSGRLKQPELKWKVYVDGSPISADPTDEAISFLLFGKLKSELNASQRLSLVSNIGANIGSVFLSTYLNQFISTYLPFILSTDINYVESQGGNLAESTDIRFTAGLGDATIRFGGQILTDLSNTNFMLEYPLNKLFKIKSVSKNLIFKFERIIDPYSQNTTTTSTNNRTGASLIYRIKF